MGLLEDYIEEIGPPNEPWYAGVEHFPSGAKILAGSVSDNLSVVHAAFQSLREVLPPQDAMDWNVWSHSPKPNTAFALKQLLNELLQRRLPLSSNAITFMLKAVIDFYQPGSAYGDHYFFWLPLSGIVRNLEWHYTKASPSIEENNLLRQLIPMLERKSTNTQKNWKLADRISRLPGITRDSRPELGEAWTDRVASDMNAMSAERCSDWEAVFAHAATADGGKPSAKWLAEAARHKEAIGAVELTGSLAAWLNLTTTPPAFTLIAPIYPVALNPLEEVDSPNNAAIRAEALRNSTEYSVALREYQATISEKNIALLKGLAWYASLCPTPEMARAVGHLTQAAFTSVVGYGTWATKAGNAGIWALGQMPGAVGVGPLARLRTRLRDRGAMKLIAAAIETAAKSAGMTVDALEDFAVPTGGLDADGTRREVFGDEGSATLTLDGKTGRTRLEWFGADGKLRKAVPAGVKREFAAEVKALKAAEAEVAQAVSAQAARLDGFLAAERVWPLSVWHERYMAHPVLGNLTRRLIWTVGGVAALPGGAAFDGAVDNAEVRLWHPINAKPEEVMQWRDALEGQGMVQPFKQAHREVYLLTDAERNTRTYSNRFAAHILKQHQFNSLCVLRGWKNSLRLMVDDSYPPATLPLPKHGLRAEFWVEGIGDNYGTDTNETGTYLRLATDQVRFYKAEAGTNYAHAGGGGYAPGYRETPAEPLPLDQIPPLVLSEVMRDVDLFVGVSSVSNDPTWADGGPEGRFRNYWQDYAFGDLSETAKTRAAVLVRLLPRLKIADRCHLDGKFLVVRGDLRTYKIHLGSGNILMEPNDQYLCIVPGRSDDTNSGDLFLPFEGDRMLAIVLSKAFLLADDKAIKDATIVSQIKRGG